MDVTTATVVISIEPEPDNDPAPFTFKPLAGQLMDEGAGVVQALDQNLDSFPTGSVSIAISQ
jgi:hypothetical protein